MNISNPTTFSAPTLTLGTANSSGSAGALRADDTILVYDTTNPDSIAYSQSAAVGSATTAARRDHSHGMAAEPSHTAASHSDQSATGDELEELTDNSVVTIHRHAKEQTFLVQGHQSAFPYDDNRGDGAVATVTNLQSATFQVAVPVDFVALVAIEIIVDPDASETLNWDVTVDFGAVGQLRTTHDDSEIDVEKVVVVNVIAALDISAAVSDIAAGDQIGIGFSSKISSIHIRHLRLRYT